MSGQYFDLNGCMRLGFIKSIQRGYISLPGASATATIVAVDINNSILLPGNLDSTFAGTNTAVSCARLEFTNKTTISAFSRTAGATLGLPFTVIEFFPGVIRSIQRFNLITTGVASGTATIAAVDMLRAALFPLLGNTDTGADLVMGSLRLTNPTTVTQTTNNPGTYPGSATHGAGMVVEFN